jgi:hypothetical protein
MQSRFIPLLALAALFVFATDDDAEARGGKGFSSGSHSSSNKGGPSSSDKVGHNPDRSAQDRSQPASSSYRGGDYRFHFSGSRDYRSQPSYPSGDYRSQQSSLARGSVTAAVPVFAPPALAAAPVVTAPVVAAPAPAAKAVDAEPRVRVEGKKHHDPGAVEWCPASAYVFDDLRGCRQKG